MLLSGQITVTTAGTAVQGPDVPGGVFAIKAHHDNTDAVWVGNDGNDDVSNDTGFVLEAKDPQLIMAVDNLSRLFFDADVSGEKITWIRFE